MKPSALNTFLDRLPANVRVLSLDCFDTLLWRTTHRPEDVFSALGNEVRPYVRIHAEKEERKHARVSEGRQEITLRGIHARIHSRSGDVEIDASAEREFEAELAHCFAFPPIVDLIRQAHDRGLRVIVVSDMYLSSAQISTLIRSAAGDEILGMVERIFSSADYGVPKQRGLFPKVLAELGVEPAEVAHIGDNSRSDVDSPKRLGIHAELFEAFPSWFPQQLRLEAMINSIFDPLAGSTRPTYQLHRSTVSMHVSDSWSPERRVGFATLGPIMHGFSAWLDSELREIARANPGTTIRPVFLLRDGYLLHRAFRAFGSEFSKFASEVAISRFTAFAATLDSRTAVVECIAERLGTKRLDSLTSQLLFNDAEAERIRSEANKADNPNQAFISIVFQKDRLKTITKRSAAFAKRLLRHVREKTSAQTGDILVLVDTGCSGTVQNRVSDLLERELGVQVEGRYLIMADRANRTPRRDGMIGPNRYDARVCESLYQRMPPIEQVCTNANGSVLDYSSQGESTVAPPLHNPEQNAAREQMQAACIDYIDAMRASSYLTPKSYDTDALRGTAVAALGRYVFLPSAAEIQVFGRFQHDMNFGTSRVVPLMDTASADRTLKREGLISTFRSPSYHLAAEIRPHGLSHSLMFIARNRYLDTLHASDLQYAGFDVPVVMDDGSSVKRTTFKAAPTNNGYFTFVIPMTSNKFTVGINIGSCCEWVQLDPVTAQLSNDLLRATETDFTELVHTSGMEVYSGGMLRCVSEEAMLVIPPLSFPLEGVWLARIVFRPLTGRVERNVVADVAQSQGSRADVISA